MTIKLAGAAHNADPVIGLRGSRPGLRQPLKRLGVAVHGDHAEQVTAGRAQRVALQPAGDQLCTQSGQAGDLRRHVVGLDVEVIARCVVDRLYLDGQARDGAVQSRELWLARHGTRRDTQRRGPEVRR